MKSRNVFILSVFLGSFAGIASAAANPNPQAAPSISHTDKDQTAKAKAPPQHEDDGQRIFQQNCARCHNAPEGFSPRISGTVVRHMRVRASLSQHEEEELLRFFNP